MKLRCTNRDSNVVVLGFVDGDGKLMSAISLPPDACDAKQGDEFRLVKIVSRAKAKPKKKAANRRAPIPDQGTRPTKK